MPFDIVLALATDSVLLLVKPFGFELTGKRLKRAGLDYWKHIELRTYENSEEFFNSYIDKTMAFFSNHGKKPYTSFNPELSLENLLRP